MAFPDLAVNAIYTVLCLVPGFLTLQTLTAAAGVEPDLTEFEKSTWSFVASGISLSLLYFGYAAWMAAATGRLALVRSLDISWVELVAVYPLLVLVAVLLGYLGGVLYRWRGTGPTRAGSEASEG